MLLEVIVAGSLLGTLLLICLQLLGAAADQHRAADVRQCAILELGNVVEQVMARPWAELTEAAAGQEKLAPSAQRQLPGAELKIAVVTEAKDPSAKRVTATLRWQDAKGKYVAPLSVTTWKYKIADGLPEKEKTKPEAPASDTNSKTTKK
jgi:hypothetical protein